MEDFLTEVEVGIHTALWFHWPNNACRCYCLFRPPRLVTKTERRVNIHPKSVNANEHFFPSPWFVYHLKLKTAQVS